MPRVKRGKTHLKRRKKLLKRAKGYRAGRKNKIKLAKTAVLKAGVYAFRDRKNKKRDFRQLWQIKIGAACKQNGLSYSKFMAEMKKGKISLNRKILADLAKNNSLVFNKLVKSIYQNSSKK